MKKPTSKIREEIARLQDQLKAAETREAERIGRIALKAGLGEIEIDEGELQASFEKLAERFRGQDARAAGKKGEGSKGTESTRAASIESGAAQNGLDEVGTNGANDDD